MTGKNWKTILKMVALSPLMFVLVPPRVCMVLAIIFNPIVASAISTAIAPSSTNTLIFLSLLSWFLVLMAVGSNSAQEDDEEAAKENNCYTGFSSGPPWFIDFISEIAGLVLFIWFVKFIWNLV